MSETAQTFLVVVDETVECAKAVRYAALRADHTGAKLMLLHVLKPSQFVQWGGVQQDMDAEAEQAGQAVLAATAAEVEALTGARPAVRLMRGRATDAVQFERESDVLPDRAPREQARLLEGDPVVLVETCSLRRLAEDLEHAGGLEVEIGDEPH